MGHVLWTAILGAVLFGAARGGARLRWSWWIPVAYVVVSVLHGLWDSNSTLSTVLAFVFTGTPFSAAQSGQVPPALAEVATTIYVVGLLVVTLLGVVVLVGVLVHHRKRDRALAAQAQAQAQVGAARCRVPDGGAVVVGGLR